MIKKIRKYSTLNRFILISIVAGVTFGLFLPEIALKQKLIGDIFISFLKMIVVPLVFSSIYTSISGLGSISSLADIGIRTFALYILTTALAVLGAIVIMNMIEFRQDTLFDIGTVSNTLHVDNFSFESMILGFIPTNIFGALSSGSMMPIIVFSALFAIASLYLEKSRKILVFEFFSAVSDAMLIMAEWVIKFTPIGVFSLISYVVAEQGADVIVGLWKYTATVAGALLFHAAAILPLLLYVLGRINPFKYLSDIREAPIMAFSTASSTVTLPVSIRVSQEVGGVDEKSASFVLPLGATVSMDGTAIYLSIAVLYIANLAGVDLGLAQQFWLGITVVALSVGVAALPSASLVMMSVILDQFGLPLEYMALIIAVDRILDMARTSVNVTSDLVVVKIIDILQKVKGRGV